MTDDDLFSVSAVNKQINDKERVAAAMENPNLREIVEQCVTEPDDWETHIVCDRVCVLLVSYCWRQNLRESHTVCVCVRPCMHVCSAENVWYSSGRTASCCFKEQKRTERSPQPLRGPNINRNRLSIFLFEELFHPISKLLTGAVSHMNGAGEGGKKALKSKFFRTNSFFAP